MMYLAPETVRMELAKPDFHGDTPGPLSRTEKPDTTFSPTGAWGNPTLATKVKGEALVTCLMHGITGDIEVLLAQAKEHSSSTIK